MISETNCGENEDTEKRRNSRTMRSNHGSRAVFPRCLVRKNFDFTKYEFEYCIPKLPNSARVYDQCHMSDD